MALTVPCPECGTKLVAPDSAVGRQLRCPKCGTLTTVPDLLPAQEVEVVEAKAVAPPPKPKPVQAEAADDDEDERPVKKSRRDEEDEEEERPRKKKRPRYVDDDDEYDHDRPRKKKRRAAGGGGGGSGALIAGVVIVGLLMLAATGFAVYYFSGKGKTTPMVQRAPVPLGWTQFNYPQDGFRVYLPKKPDYTSVPAEFLRRDEAPGGVNGGRVGAFGLGRGNTKNEFADAERFTMVQAGGEWHDPVRAELIVFKFRDKVPLSVREQFRKVAREGNVEGVPVRTVLWLGGDALEQRYPNGVVRVMYTDRYFVIAAIAGRNGERAKSEEEAGFFDNIELLD
jgi:hypothetical protein